MHAEALAGAGREADAVPLFEQALRERVAAGETDHPEAFAVRAQLAVALERLGRSALAAAVAAQAAQGLKSGAGERRRAYADVLALRARVAVAAGRPREARAHALESDAVRLRHLRSTVRFLGERQALSYVGEIFPGRDAVLSLLSRGRPDEDTRRAGLELTAGARNVVLDELAARGRARAARAGDPAEALLFAAQARVATLIYRGVDAGDERVVSAEREVTEAGRVVTLRLAARSSAEAPLGDLVPRLAQRLAPGSALVSVVSYQPLEPGSARAYLAFVLRAGARAPQVVALGEASAVDARVSDWRRAIVGARRSPGRSQRDDRLAATRALSASLWTPLRSALRGVRRVFLVPDGSLHLVNFAALVDERGEFLVESGPTFHQLGSERELLGDRARAVEPRLLIAAAPEFDDRQALVRGPTVGATAPPRVASSERTGEIWRGGRGACSSLAELSFERLPAARREAHEVETVARAAGLASTLLEGPRASEFALKSSLGGHSLVHLASHAFVANAACASGRGVTLSPLLFSGLALGGANRRAEATPDEEDGILTAQEISALDLRAADWVVLSACDTGGGEIRNAEGVLGLRRAFAIAGAGTVIMSLWPVEDDDARVWMRELYAARLKRGLDSADSVRAASRAVLEHLRARGRSPDPARWAAFVAAGDWR